MAILNSQRVLGLRMKIKAGWSTQVSFDESNDDVVCMDTDTEADAYSTTYIKYHSKASS